MTKKTTKNYFALIAFTAAMILSVSSKAQIYWDFGATASLSAYPTSGIPANITVDSVTKGNSTGTPFLSTTSVSSGYLGASANGNAGVTAKIGALDYTVNATTGSAFYEITLTPDAGYYINVTGIGFGSRSTATGPKKYSIRTDLDGYATEIAGDTISSVTSAWGLRTEALSVSGTTGTPLKLRIYGYAGAGAVSAINFRIDDLVLNAVAISSGLTAAFNTTDICFGTIASFTDASTSVGGTLTNWEWNFGDGSPVSNLQNPTHTYTSGGLFNVRLIVMDNLARIDTALGTIYVDSVASVLSSSLAGAAVTFTGFGSLGTSPYTYLFDLGEGAGYAPIANPNSTYTYSTPGTYTACLISTDAMGCFDTSCTTFTILSTGISQHSNSKLLISPNPSTTGMFSIDLSELSGKSNITIYDIIGNIVFTKETTSNTKQLIDLSAQANGSYFVSITTDAEVITKKIILNK